MSAVVVEGLTFSYSGGDAVLRDISFTAEPREVLVIAGRSGCGKTTLCRILAGIIPHAVNGDAAGRIEVMDIDPRTVGLPQTALRAGLVFQDADSQIIGAAVEDELAFSLENACLPRDEIRRRVDELAAEFGFSGSIHKNPAQLSGGQKKLLTIAAVLAAEPVVLILDEPLSCLDDAGRALVRNAVIKQRDSGRAVIIVEHDLDAVTFADKWLILDDGEVIAYGAPDDVMSRQESLLREAGVWQ